MKYDYFLASRWRNRDAVLALARGIREKGKTLYCFLEAPHSVDRVDSDPEEDMAKFEARSWKHDDYVKEVFENDMNAEREAKALILLLPAGKSAHIEAGVAYGMGKECILIGEQKEAESLYLIFDKHYDNPEAFLETL